MKFVNILDKPPQYDFVDRQCIGRTCFHAVTEKGRNGCFNRMHHGCPTNLPPFSKTTADANHAKGWRPRP